MEAYRDQYAQLFNNGNGVTVLAVSSDDVETQQAWAAEAKFPVTFVSDPAAVAGNAYDVKYPAVNMFRRVVFVVDKEGRIAHVMRPFRELSAGAYTELGEAVKKARGAN
jgi:peroxiredoxin Q/BCP